MAFYGGGGRYYLGAGDYNPANDVPWTASPIGLASDCRFAFCFCWKVTAHRPGYNRGSWASVSDDVNYNSLIEDGDHGGELVETGIPLLTQPRPGDIICYPTFSLPDGKGGLVKDEHGVPLKWIGHGAIVVSVPHDYVPGEGWHRLTIIQCHGPNGFYPGVVCTDGSVFDHHDSQWPKAMHRTHLVRPKERA